MQKGRTGTGASSWYLPVMTAGLIIGIVLGRAQEASVYGAVVLLASSAAALLLHGRVRMVCCMMAAAGLGACLASEAYHPARPAEGDYAITGVVVQEIHMSPDGQVQTVLDDVTLGGVPTGKRAYWTWYRKSPDVPLPEWFMPGSKVAFTGEVYQPSGAQNPGGFDFNEYLLQRGITFAIYDAEELMCVPGAFSLQGWLASVRHTLTFRLMAAMGEESGAYAAAVLLGSRDYLPAEDVEAFRKLGVAHVLSVSGWHVGILVMLAGVLLKPLRLPKAGSLMVKALLLAAYAMLAGGNAPIIRASILLLMREAGMLRRHRNVSLHLLCFTAVCQLLISPVQLFSASFQLTYSAMAGIMLVYPWLRSRFRPVSPLLAKLWEALAAALAAQLGVLPAQLYWFGELPALSVVMNIAVAGLLSGVMALYWLLLALLPVPWAGEALAGAVGQLTAWMLAGIRWLASAAGMMIWTKQANGLTLLGCGCLMAGMCILLRTRTERLRRWLAALGAVLIVASLVPLPCRGTVWMQLSVGDADAAVLRDDDMVVVVDAGRDANDLHYMLRDERLTVDLLILTHLHSDHAGGAQAFVDMGIPVRRCLLPEDVEIAGELDAAAVDALEALKTAGTEIAHLSRGDVIGLPNGQLTVLWPQEGAVRPGQDANHSCLVLLAELRGSTMLLTGDLSGTYEMYCAEPADILKAAHHGSEESSRPPFLDAVAPQTILLSCGKESRETGLRERTGDIPLYSTHSQGAIAVRFAENAFMIETYLNEKNHDGP